MRSGRVFMLPMIAAFCLIYLPLLTVAVFSFSGSAAPGLPIDEFTLRWYAELWADASIRDALRNTAKIAAGTVVLSLLLATAAALAVRHKSFRGRGLYEFVIGMPFLMPEVVLGVALLSFFSQAGIDLSLRTVLIGHVLFSVGAAFRVIAARLESLPSSLESAAHDLGRGAFGAFWYVTLPGLRSALVAASVLVVALSFDQTVITIFVTGSDNTLPTLLWAKMRIGFTPEVNALATVIFGATVVLVSPMATRIRKAADEP